MLGKNWSDFVNRDDFLSITKAVLNSTDSVTNDLYVLLKNVAESHNIEEETFVLFYIALCDYMGGQAVYFPTTTKLESTLLKHLVHSEFNGYNHSELARKYRISDSTLRRYIADIDKQLKDARKDLKDFL